MKAAVSKKLVVRKETLRSLTMRDLAGAAGGAIVGAGASPAETIHEPQGFIMQDTKIVPTSRR